MEALIQPIDIDEDKDDGNDDIYPRLRTPTLDDFHSGDKGLMCRNRVMLKDLLIRKEIMETELMLKK